MRVALESGEFRRILGHYPAGVCAITAWSGDRPVGMVVGSFTSVSLQPPLVVFLPDRESTTWPAIQAAARFCFNVLSERQQHVCRAPSSKATDNLKLLAVGSLKRGFRFRRTSWPGSTADSTRCMRPAITSSRLLRSWRWTARPHPPFVFLKGVYGSFSPLGAEAAERPVDAGGASEEADAMGLTPGVGWGAGALNKRRCRRSMQRGAREHLND